MATITGLTAERMLEIEGGSVIQGEVIAGRLILTRHDGTTVDAGPVVGPAGPVGPAGSGGIPGEVKLWPGGVLPDTTTFGKWVWADGGVYVVATYPIAAGHIATQWRTFGGASDPGASNFRVPDLRGLVPAGLDAMPGGSRANRMTRAVAITIAARTGEETHIITLPESPAHAHGVTDNGHVHGTSYQPPTAGYDGYTNTSGASIGGSGNSPSWNINSALTGISIQSAGGGGAHENVQPTVFVPYIVKLDG
jgi:microcystin-dependent protein